MENAMKTATRSRKAPRKGRLIATLTERTDSDTLADIRAKFRAGYKLVAPDGDTIHPAAAPPAGPSVADALAYVHGMVAIASELLGRLERFSCDEEYETAHLGQDLQDPLERFQKALQELGLVLANHYVETPGWPDGKAAASFATEVKDGLHTLIRLAKLPLVPLDKCHAQFEMVDGKPVPRPTLQLLPLLRHGLKLVAPIQIVEASRAQGIPATMESYDQLQQSWRAAMRPLFDISGLVPTEDA
jgi:hypothetical protein